MVAPATRARVVQAITTAALSGLLGHAGTGKSMALRAAHAEHDGPKLHLDARIVDASRLRDLSDDDTGSRSSSGGGMLLTIDNVEVATSALTVAIADLMGTWPSPSRVAVAGRRLPPPILSAIEDRGGRLVRAPELEVTDEELEEFLGGLVTARLRAGELHLLAERCARWPVVLDGVARELRSATVTDDDTWNELVRRFLVAPSAVRSQVEMLVAAAPTRRLQDAVVRLSGLPAFDDALCQQLGVSAGVDELRNLGLPLREVDHGLIALRTGVRDVLQATSPEPTLARSAATRYLEVGRPDAALEVLATPATATNLSAMLAQLPIEDLGRLDPARYAAAVGAIPPQELAARPQILVRLADALVLVGQTEEYRETLARARWLIDAYPGTASMADRLEVRAAELTMRAIAVGDASVLAAAESLLATPALPTTARARLLGGLGRAAAATGTATDLRRGARQLARSAQLFTQAEAGIHAAASLTVAAIHANLPLGRYDLALEQLDQALHAGRDTPRARVAVLSHRPFVLIDLGRYQDAETDLAELRRSAHGTGTTGNDRAAAYARWGAARIASQRGAAQPTWAACQAVASSSAIIGTDDHAAFAADAAQLLARVGRTGEARRFLHDAQRRRPRSPTTLLLSNFVVAAHAGEHDRAIAALAALEDGGVVQPRDRWRVTLLHAHVLRIHGHEDAGAMSAAAFEQAAQLGFPNLPLIREPQIARGLRWLGSPHSASVRAPGLRDGTRLRVLGELSLERDGTATRLGGRTGELFALLALHGGSVTVDRAIDALWPSGETRKGRERLRTVLHRTRTNHGPLIERRESTLQLDADVQIDVEEFLELVRRARSPQTQPHLAAGVAIDAYTGEAAPGYDDHGWVMTIRRHLERELLEMHDLMIAAAEEAGDLDEAIRAAEAAIVIDATAEHYHLTIARLLAEQGHGRRALWRLTDIRSTLLEQGLVPSQEMRRLEGYLARRLAT